VEALDALLIELSRSLEKVTSFDKPKAQADHLELWLVDSQKLYAQLERNQHLSWYNPNMVRQKLDQISVD